MNSMSFIGSINENALGQGVVNRPKTFCLHLRDHIRGAVRKSIPELSSIFSRYGVPVRDCTLKVSK